MITFSHVNKWFGALQVLRDISLSVEAGDVLVVCGPSGSWKSTLIHCINRLEPIQKGDLIVDGMNVHDRKTNMTQLRAEIGFIFQQFNLYPHMTALGNITLAPMKVRKLKKEEAEKLGKEILERVGLSDKVDSYPAQLSGGQQQRVALARALAPKPHLLLMDEPFSNLDVTLRERLSMEVRDILKEYGTTALFVTHNQNEAFAVADQIGVMYNGEILQWDSAHNLYHQPVSPRIAEFVGEGSLIGLVIKS